MPEKRWWTRDAVQPPEGVPPSDLNALETLLLRTLERGFRWMYFPPPLERLFEQETGPARSRHLVLTGIVCALCTLAYTLYALADRQLLPGSSSAVYVLRFGIVTPVVLAASFAVWLGLRPLARELTVAVALSAGPILMLAISGIEADSDLSALRGTMILVLLGATVFVRLRFWFAVGVCVALTTLQLLVPPLAGVPQPANVPLLLITVVVALGANYSIEREHRTNYLHRLFARVQSRKLEEVAVHWQLISERDPLTGIENRRSLDRKLEALYDRGEQYSIILIDVDGFKAFNDQYGHQQGDECLRRIAAILRASLRRTTDSAARLGGEEFAVVLPDTSVERARVAAERMRRAVLELRIPHTGSAAGDIVSISAGVSATDGSEPPSSVIARADAALYEAKSAGRNRVVMAGPTASEARASQ
ncbi:MAG TPA: diguanylate cyclase [Longimicrobiales bacterium]|nr:diguanylate cyclase [Longimicrobiales bacterium]